MTIDEAIKILKDGRKNLYGTLDKSVPYEQQHTLVALDMAIRSLEAWELAKAEILKAQTYKMFVGDTDLYVERKDVLKIIEKHLQEVENDSRKRKSNQ